MTDLVEIDEQFHACADAGQGDDWYRKEYVPRALRAVLDHLERVHGPSVPCKILVLLCGTSPAPLLLSTARVRPERVVVVGSTTTQGRQEATALEGVLSGGPMGPDDKPSFLRITGLHTMRVDRPVYIDPSDPARAYRTLVDDVLAPLIDEVGRDGIILDVTGGKKTMMAAAFMAASELGLRTQYVDFDRYHASSRLPYPSDAQVRLLKSPAAELRLREIRAAKDAFDNERFGEATARLTTIVEALESLDPGYASARELQEMKLRLAYATACQSWSEARYGDALQGLEAEALRSAGVTIPPAVAVLGPRWQATKREEWRNELGAPKAVAAYAADELWRHRRALAREHEARIPFLRTFALVEVLLGAALYAHREHIMKPNAKPLESAKTETPEKLGRTIKIGQLAGLASSGETKGFELKKGLLDVRSAAPLATEDNHWSTLRNACTHAVADVRLEDARPFIGSDGDAGLAGSIAAEVLMALGANAEADALESGDRHRPLGWDWFVVKRS